MQVWALIVDSFRESIDRKMFWVMVFMSAVVAAAMACISFDDKGVDILFGVWKFEDEVWSLGNSGLKGMVGTVAVKFIADQYLGFFGMIVALITTAGVFPGLMTSGTIDLVLSKPMPRWKLFLGKYLGALVFVFLQAVLFVGLTFLVMGVRWHCWMLGYLGLIPLMVILFSYLYAFTALFGVLTRSALTSLLLTMIAWLFIWTPPMAAGTLSMMREASMSPVRVDGEPVEVGASFEKWERLFRTMSWFVPKTSDIVEIAGQWVEGALISDILLSAGEPESEEERKSFEDGRRMEERAAAVNPWTSIGSSLLCEAVIVFFAMYQFGRRDF